MFSHKCVSAIPDRFLLRILVLPQYYLLGSEIHYTEYYIFLMTKNLSRWCYYANVTTLVRNVTERERNVVNMESGCCLHRSSPSSSSEMNTKERLGGGKLTS
jgi:hypothetical protein